jgi:hypothetical protein
MENYSKLASFSDTYLYSLAFHTHVETFLIATILTSIPLPLVDNTIAPLSTCVR